MNLDSNTLTTSPEVCVVGLGYVGLTLSAALAIKGVRVIGVEKNPWVVETINLGSAPFHEEGLDEAISDLVKRGSLVAQSTTTSLPSCPTYIITVGTPVKNGELSMSDLEDALSSISNAMPDSALVVLRSTVRVGTTRKFASSILEKSGKTFHLAMAPERTIEGQALSELFSLPQIVGGVDETSTTLTAEIFSRLGVEIVKVSTSEAAELSKLASNTFRDVQFAFANELAYFSDSSGVDFYEVVRACNHGYPRMNLAKPGPVAGPCLEKDAYILQESAREIGVEVPLSLQGRKTNEAIVQHTLKSMRELGFQPNSTLGILGIAFKGRPATSDTRGSLALNFSLATKDNWVESNVIGWDPLVSGSDIEKLAIDPQDLTSTLNKSDFLLIQTNHPYFASNEFKDLIVANCKSGSIVIDLWNQLDTQMTERSDIQVFALGRMSVGRQ